jgi:S1-C subfamily serine protease
LARYKQIDTSPRFIAVDLQRQQRQPVWHPDTGEVLGVVNSVYVKGAKEAALSAPSGISYAIPVKYVHQLLEQALQKAK